MLTLRDHVLSAEAYTMRLMLALLGVTHERQAVDAYPGGAEVPVLEEGDLRLTDPGVALLYLSKTYGPAWLPDERAADVARWLSFVVVDLRPLADARRLALFGGEGDIEALNAKGRVALRTIEDALTRGGVDGRDWLAAEVPTVADIAVFPSVMLSHDSGLGHEDYPGINLWQRRVRRLPGFIGMPGIPDYF